MPNSQASEREGVSAGELPEGLRPADAQCVCDDQLPGGQSRVGENLQATRKNQSHGCPEPRGRTGRDADGTSLGNRRGVATKTGDHQPDRIVSVDGAAGGAERQALAGRQSAAALDGHRTLGGGTALPKDQRLSRTLSAEGAVESVHHSAEGGPSSTGCLMLVARRFTLSNLTSRCDQLKLGHPPLCPRHNLSSWMVGKPEVNHGTLGLQGWHAGLEEVLLHAL